METQTPLQKLEETAKQEKARGRFKGFLEIEEFDETPHFSAQIDSKELKNILLKVNPAYQGNTSEVIRDLTRHEINHKQYDGFNGCPRTLENHAELIIEPISEVLLPKGYSMDDVHYIANAFEDTVLHSDLSRTFSLEGIISFFDDVGRTHSYTDFYEAHVKLNLYLTASKKQKRRFKKHFKHNKPVAATLKTFLERAKFSSLRAGNHKDQNQIRSFLTSQENWGDIAKVYAEEFSKLMQPGYALPLINHSGKGTKGRETKKTEEGNLFDKEMYTRDFKQKRIQRAFERNKSTPKWMDSFEALHLLYQSLAQKRELKVESYTKQSSMPVYHYGNRPFNPEKDNFKHVAVGFDEQGRLELKKKRWHEDTPLEYKVDPRGFPEVRFGLIDTSGSMKEDPKGGKDIGSTKIIPWGTNSKYHYALLEWYNLLEYLKQNHLLSQQGIFLGNFSSETSIGEGLDSAIKNALTPQFGGTYIDINILKRFFKDEGMLLFTISDGEIMNWKGIKDEFLKLAKKHHYFHLQIGSRNSFTDDLESAGLYVEPITSANDLAGKVVDLTDKFYRSTQ